MSITEFFVDLWNKIKRDSSAPAMNISNNDIVVFVVGPTGSGKSWFTKAATNSPLVIVSRRQHPSTSGVQAIRCELTDEAKNDPGLQEVSSIVFVDSPSFLTGYARPDAHEEFRKWFDKIKFDPRDVGVTYVHRIESDPTLNDSSIKAHLDAFSKISWPSHISRPRRLHVIISHDKTSSTISESKIAQRRSTLENQVESLLQSTNKWRPSIHEECFCGEAEVAWKAVEELFRD